MKLGRSNGKILKRNGKLCRGCCESVPVVFLARACPSDGVCSTPPTDDILVIDPEATCTDGSPVGGTGDQIIRYNGWCYSIDSVPTRAEDAPTDAPILTGVVGECFERCRPDVVGDEGSCFSEFRYVFYPRCSTAGVIVGDGTPEYIALCADNAVENCESIYIAQLDRCYSLDPDRAVFSNTLDGAVPSYLDLTQDGLTGQRYGNCCQCTLENDVPWNDGGSNCTQFGFRLPPCDGDDPETVCCIGGRDGASLSVTVSNRFYDYRETRGIIVNPTAADDCFPGSGLIRRPDEFEVTRTLTATYQWNNTAQAWLLASASGSETTRDRTARYELLSTGCAEDEVITENTVQLGLDDAPDAFSLSELFRYDDGEFGILQCIGEGSAFGSVFVDEGAGCQDSGTAEVSSEVASLNYSCIQGTSSYVKEFTRYRTQSPFIWPDCSNSYQRKEIENSVVWTATNDGCSSSCGVAAPITSEGFF